MFRRLPLHLLEYIFIEYLSFRDMVSIQCLNSEFRYQVQTNEKFWYRWTLAHYPDLFDCVLLAGTGGLARFDINWHRAAIMIEYDLKNKLHIEILISLIRERLEQPMYVPGAFRIQCQIKTSKLGIEIANQVEIEQTGSATIAFIFFKEDKSNILLHHYNSSIESIRVDRRLKGNQHQFSEINNGLTFTIIHKRNQTLLSKSDYRRLGIALHNQENYYDGERVAQHTGRYASVGRIGHSTSTAFGSNSTVVERPHVDIEAYRSITISVRGRSFSVLIDFLKRLLRGEINE